MRQTLDHFIVSFKIRWQGLERSLSSNEKCLLLQRALDLCSITHITAQNCQELQFQRVQQPPLVSVGTDTEILHRDI